MTTRLGPCGFVWFLFALALGGVCALLISQGLAHRREVPTTEVKIARSCGRVTDVVLLADDGTVTSRSTLTTSVGTCRERLEVVTVPVRAEMEPEPVRHLSQGSACLEGTEAVAYLCEFRRPARLEGRAVCVEDVWRYERQMRACRSWFMFPRTSTEAAR